MSVASESLSLAASLPASRAFRWCMDGLRLWRRAPITLFLLCVAQLVVEALLQLIPWAGVTLSKLMVPMLVMGILRGLDELAQGQRLRWSSPLDCLRGKRFLPTLGLAALWGFTVFGVQQLSAWLIYGWPAVDAVWLGHAAAHRELMGLPFTRVLLLPGVLPGVLLMLAPCLFLSRGLTPWRAICESVRTVLHYPRPFALFLLLNLAVFALVFSTHWAFVLVLVYVPWSTACTYAVWHDLSSRIPASSR